MMNVLLESKPRKQRKLGGTLFSVVFHSAIVFFAVYATARAGVPEVREDRAEKVTFVKTKKVVEAPKPAEPKPEPPKAQPKPKSEPKAAAAPKPSIEPPKGFKVLEAPITIPTVIPTIDPSAAATNEADFSGTGTRGGSSEGTGTGTGTVAGPAVDADRNYASFEVEQEVRAISGTSVAYPEAMRSSGAEGQVLAEFVVNEQGRVETSSFKVLESTNSVFTSAVKAALPRMRFRPAQIGSTKVAQVVQQAFVFKLNR
jgi:protein TonB